MLFVATLLVPLEATLVVNFDTIDSLGWINTYQGLAVPFLATAFGMFLVRQVFMTLPRDLRDAAAIDGVGHLGFLRHVARAARASHVRGARTVQLPVVVESVPVAEPGDQRRRHEHGAERSAVAVEVESRPNRTW